MFAILLGVGAALIRRFFSNFKKKDVAKKILINKQLYCWLLIKKFNS